MLRFLPSRSRSLVAALLSALLALAAAGPLRAQVVINEVLAANGRTVEDEDGDTSDWLELHNAGTAPVELAGYSLTDDPAVLRLWPFPETSLAPGAYLLLWCSGKDRTSIPDERLTERDSPLFFDADLVSLEDEWRYVMLAPEDGAPPTDWKSPGFDDSSWTRGRPGFGFGRDDGIRTELPVGPGVIFLRTAFDFVPGRRNLVLQVRYDDGFVAYLNGARVAADGFPEGEEPTGESTSSGSHSPRLRERFDLTPWLDRLQPQGNVLAIALVNRSPTSNDLILFPELGTVPPPLHTNFKISSAGETILLVDPTGEAADHVTLPPQTSDHSYGRSPDGDGPFLFHRTPTPAAPNEGPAAAQPLLVADTKFSVDRGFYDEPFEVEVTTETEGAEIRFTLDGTPPTETAGFAYEGPIPIDRTTTLRARAFKDGYEPTNVDTQTYIFLDDILRQDYQATLAAGFPRTWGTFPADYGMDPDVIGPNDRFGGVYAETVRDDLLSLPSLSIVMDIDDMFGPQGIYTNSQQGGVLWERATSVELIGSDGGEFQVDCGIRIQGGWFRSHSGARKHSFRLLFKREYGPTKLKYDWFGGDAVDRFDTITLRAGANDGYSWADARLTEQYTRDEFGRSLQRATGNAGAHGTFVHLYINGVYWGLYNPVERPDHSFSASYHGGEKEDWDAVHDLAATNGDPLAWGEMIRMTAAARTALAPYMELQGANPDGTPNPDSPHLLDVPNYVDYLVVNLWGGNWDWPWKNWWAGRDRTARSTGFKFYCWDYENTIGNNRGRSPLSKDALQNDFSSAGEPHRNLRTNPEYRMLFGDRVHRYFFNGGVLTPESLIPRYDELAARVERAIVPESARWGDQHHPSPLTLREWQNERNWVLGTYLPQRTDIVLEQFRRAGLYPRVEAPVYNRHGGLVAAGFRVLPHATDGVVYYTADGADPRLLGGEVSPAALVADAGEPVVLVPETALARIHVPADGALGLEWTAVDFDDSAWLEGGSAVGFETGSGYEDLIATDVGASMHDINASIYLRIAFDVADPALLVFPTLRMRYDDGFVAYLNGERVADRGGPESPEWDSRAVRARADSAAVVFDAIDLGEHAATLRPGRNVLAIHGLNSRSADGDFLIHPALVATDPAGAGLVIERSTLVRSRAWVDGEWSALSEAAFVVDTDIPLRVTEIMYHPAEPPPESRYDADEFEFIELQNVGAGPLDLSEIRLLGGVRFDFADSEVEVLGPGEHLVLVENLKAFRTRYDVEGMLIAGQYAGRLGNGGDTLVLEGFLGEPILEFTYDDEWHTETDGEGSSLVILDPLAPRESWNDGASWRASAAGGGSPGAGESDGGDIGGRQRPGDVSQDGRLTITDPVLLLRYLFIEAAPALPCEGGSIGAGGNRALLDADGNGGVALTDAVVLLNYMFQRGAPPALGAECVRIRGCPEACGG